MTTDRMDETDIVLATDGSAYQNWQCAVFRDTMRGVGQRGRYVEVVDGSGEDITYPTHHRIKAMKRYLETATAQSVWMMDPDMVFTGRLELAHDNGVAVGEPIRDHLWAEIIPHAPEIRRRFSRRPERDIAFTQVPWILTREDLARVIERWDALIYEVFHDARTRALPGWNPWVTTSWCYWLVLAEYGIAQRVLPLAHFPYEEELRLPLIHYCHKMRSGFYKRSYQPWTPIAAPRGDVPICERVTLEIIDAYARAQSPVSV
ncbi:MAG TPA: hypothetical protein VL752_21120 [Acidisoma sp.]|uniref:hypothetical protein n=1 Tax=Acidisoma sp. TaxID=1872115 RepID=UPI002CF5CCBE|nr:hypothetical protein [Acidisoma sp.]HTI03455.1 hypothetical protein [Acidisoma sp.]